MKRQLTGWDTSYADNLSDKGLWQAGLNKHFSKETTHLHPAPEKSFHTIVFRKMQIKATVRSHFAPTRTATIFQKGKIVTVDRDIRERRPSAWLPGVRSGHVENGLAASQRSSARHPCHPRNQRLYPKGTWSTIGARKARSPGHPSSITRWWALGPPSGPPDPPAGLWAAFSGGIQQSSMLPWGWGSCCQI